MLIVNDSGNKCSWQDKTNGLKSLNLFSWSVFTMCDTVLKAIHFLNDGCSIYSCDFYISFCQGRAKNLILYHTIYKQGITKFFSNELLLGEDRSCGNVTAIVTASFQILSFTFKSLILCRLFIDAKCQKGKRMQRVPGGISSTCVSSYRPWAQQGAGIPSPFFPRKIPTGQGQQKCSQGNTAPLWHTLLFPGGIIHPLPQSADQVTAEGLGSQAMVNSAFTYLTQHIFFLFTFLRISQPLSTLSRRADE